MRMMILDSETDGILPKNGPMQIWFVLAEAQGHLLFCRIPMTSDISRFQVLISGVEIVCRGVHTVRVHSRHLPLRTELV